MGLTDWFMYVKWRAKTQAKRNHRVWERVRLGGGWWRRVSRFYRWSMDPWWGKESIESDRDKWSVRDREKEFQTYACWPQPFFSQLINTGKCMCGFVLLCMCMYVWGEVLVSVIPNKDQKHSDITSVCSDSPLAFQPLHMPLFNFEACNPIKAWEVWST